MIIFDATRPIIKSDRPFGLGIVEPTLTAEESRAVSEARARAYRDARHAGQPLERIEAAAEEAARTATECVLSLRHTAADEQWWAAESARLESRRVARHYDRRAAESLATDSLTRGLIPAGLADVISRSSLVGHPE